uniref:Sensory protein kinase PcoS n=1 Tax=Klebsiella pneumoniae TaxID=573 RepID=A0A8B0STE9_KLEPN|nr:Sensory protein kinase PcoS [Klebsiella pneumoniae]
MNFDSDTNVIDVAVRRLRSKIDDDFEPKTDPYRSRCRICPGDQRRVRFKISLTTRLSLIFFCGDAYGMVVIKFYPD